MDDLVQIIEIGDDGVLVAAQIRHSEPRREVGILELGVAHLGEHRGMAGKALHPTGDIHALTNVLPVRQRLRT